MARKAKLTQALVDKEPLAEGEQVFVRDTLLPGFGLRVGKTKKSYVVEARTKGRPRRRTLADAQHIPIEEARKRAKVLLAAFAEGRDLDREAETAREKTKSLSEAFEQFLFERQAKLAPKTVYDYRLNMDRFFGDWQAHPIRSVSPIMFMERFDRITTESGQASATSATRLLSAIWTHARETSRDPDGAYTLPETPTSIIKGTKKQHKQTRRKTYVKRPRDFFRALSDVPSFEFRVFVELVYRTGARRSEISNLQWVDIDFAASTALFRKTKNGTDHLMPLSSQAVALLRDLRGIQEDGVYIWGKRQFGDPRGSLAKLVEGYGEPFMYHDLRRSFINLCEDCEIPSRTVKILINHLTEDVTDGYGTRDIGPKHFVAVQKVSDLLDWRVFPVMTNEWLLGGTG